MPPPWTTANIPSQSGRRVLLTGANSGIGFETALALARHGAEIILPARTPAEADAAIARILHQVPSARLHPELLDLASQHSVRAFADRILTRFPGPSLDLLINNAGVMALPTRQITEDGFERQFATNHLGPFALTALLLPAIKPQPGSRIVNVSSLASEHVKLNFANLQSERFYRPMFQAYAQSKLANLLFTRELQRRLTAIGSPILSTAAHPGWAVTNLQADHLRPGLKLLVALLQPFVSQSAASGALPTLYAATSPNVTPGGFYGPNGFQHLTGHPAPATLPKQARNTTTAQRLWAESERLTGVRFPQLPDAA